MKCIWIAAGMLGAMSVAARSEPLTLETQPTPEVQKLKDRVDELEKEVARLKSELARRPVWVSVRPQTEQAVPYRQFLNAIPSQPHMPPGVLERKFNGDTYYVVPLNSGVESAGTVTARTLQKRQMPAAIVPPELLNPSK